MNLINWGLKNGMMKQEIETKRKQIEDNDNIITNQMSYN
jgi:hypothetical protein